MKYQLKIKKKHIRQLIRNSDYTTGNLLDYDYFCTYYKLIAIDSSKQDVDLSKQQINFIGRLEE